MRIARATLISCTLMLFLPLCTAAEDRGAPTDWISTPQGPVESRDPSAPGETSPPDHAGDGTGASAIHPPDGGDPEGWPPHVATPAPDGTPSPGPGPAGVPATAAPALAAAAGLFTRTHGMSVLEHPNRRALFDYIDAHPGTTFRELLRATDMAAGTARHHLSVMLRCEVVVERAHGQTMRYFHPDQEHLGDWDAVVVLRQPDMDRIYRWLLDHPGVIQRTVLDAAESWGWSRSTTQHRLKRLVDNDLAQVRDLGRSKAYRARAVGAAGATDAMRAAFPRPTPGVPHSMGQ